MISIRKSVDDLERLDELEKRENLANTILECYALAIHSSAHYVVEVDLAHAAEFRKHLTVIEEQCRSAASVDQVRAAQASFRGELREYRDKSAGQLKKLRQEMADASAAMAVFAATVTSNGEDHEQQVGAQLKSLKAAARSLQIDDIRSGIGAAVAGIQSSVEQIQRGNQLVVVQLQDEIRALHRQIEEERRALYTDSASGAWNRSKIDTHIDNLLRQNQPFCLLLVRVRNLKRIDSQHSRTVLEGTLKAMVARFSAMIGEGAVIGRWSPDQFVAVLDLLPAQAMSLSAEANTRLSGVYAVQENGQSQKVTVQAATGVIDRAAGAPADNFHRRLEQLTSAMTGG